MDPESPTKIERGEKRQWAARLWRLPQSDAIAGLDSDAGDAATAAMLALLPEEDWVPPERLATAWSYLQDDFDLAAETTPCDWRDREAALRDELDAFAAEFFEISVAERTKRLFGFGRRAAGFPRQISWLVHLSRGVRLDLNHLTDPNPKVAELIRLVAQSFVLRAPLRAPLWRERLERMAEEIPGWETAARALQAKHPSVAALLPEPIQQLSDYRAADRRIERAYDRYKTAPQPAGRKPVARPAAGGSRSFAWLLWLLLIPAIRLMTSSASCMSPSQSSSHYSPTPEVLEYLQKQREGKNADRERDSFDKLPADESKWVLPDDEKAAPPELPSTEKLPD